MAKCVVSGMAPGGGDGWVLMDEWDAVQSTPITSWEYGYCFYGSLKDIDFSEYSIAKTEVTGNLIVNNGNSTEQETCRVSVYPQNDFRAYTPPHSTNYTAPVKLTSTAFLSFKISNQADAYANICTTYPQTNRGDYITYPNKIDGVALRMNTSSGIAIVSANLHVKVYAKK